MYSLIHFYVLIYLYVLNYLYVLLIHVYNRDQKSCWVFPTVKFSQQDPNNKPCLSETADVCVCSTLSMGGLLL